MVDCNTLSALNDTRDLEFPMCIFTSRDLHCLGESSSISNQCRCHSFVRYSAITQMCCE